jgi:hypothetical protein
MINAIAPILEPIIAVPHYITPEEYLERQSQIRHEYRYGLVYLMAGGTFKSGVWGRVRQPSD